MLTAVQGTYENGQIILDEVPPVQERAKVIVTFLEPTDDPEPATFESVFPHLHRWIDMDGKVEIGYDSMGYSNSLVMCHDEGGTVYWSPSTVTDIQQALELADAAIRDWINEHMPGEL